MANLAERHDEEHNAQLADAEISRIMSALQKAEFKRSETGNARPAQTFKPRSLMEIAETARQQDEAEKAMQNGEALDDTVDEMAAGQVLRRRMKEPLNPQAITSRMGSNQLAS